MQIPLKYVTPYRLQRWSPTGVVRRAFWIGDVPVVVQLEQANARAAVTARAFSDRPLTPLRSALGKAAHHMAAADEDAGAFRRAVAADPGMSALARRMTGLKPFRIPDLWTSLLRSLLSQQISTAAARAIERRMATRFGRMIHVDGEEVPVLPQPATLIALPDTELRAAGLSQRKGEYARSLAEHVLDGTLEFERLRRADLEEVVETMTRIRGVGRWTAECTALFGLGHRDVLPADDLGIRKAIARLNGTAALPSTAEVREIGRKWEGWRSYASIYLWRSLEEK